MKRFLVIIFLFPLFLFAEPDVPKPVMKVKKITKPQIFKTGARPRLQIGFQGGANLNYYIYHRNRTQKDVGFGYQGGVFFRVTRQKAFVQFEMNYLWSQVIFKNEEITTELGKKIQFETLTLRYHTFGIPFIFGAYAVKKPVYKLRFYNGLEVDFITRAKAIIDQNTADINRLKRSEKKEYPSPSSIQLPGRNGNGYSDVYFRYKI